ncbi:hypothetical protein QL285_087419 [Trifolium repens]|nr:hypothetical protein QL285_087419 [Trifolium repens]
MMPKTPEYTLNFRFDSSEESKSPLLSPFSVRISNYSTLEENEENENSQVDDEAEDFIRRFYEQLKTQSLVQLPKFKKNIWTFDLDCDIKDHVIRRSGSAILMIVCNM